MIDSNLLVISLGSCCCAWEAVAITSSLISHNIRLTFVMMWLRYDLKASLLICLDFADGL